uniref:Uncharacterized protein n=1 Tax=Helianthus annuus TaxID=4232 RepID=A0A251VR71_HELAN
MYTRHKLIYDTKKIYIKWLPKQPYGCNFVIRCLKDLVFQLPNQPTHSRIQVEDLQNR